MKSRALAGLVLACFGAATADGEIVHFSNPAPGEAEHYDWHWEPTPLFTPIVHNWLDVTRPSAEQTNAVNDDSVGQGGRVDGFLSWSNWTGSGALVAAGAIPSFDGSFTQGLQYGEALADLGYHSGATHAWGSSEEPFEASLIPAGERRYVGVQISGGRYGWIEVERQPGSVSLTALSWAYETEAGVPIAAGHVPAPTGLALLICGAVASPRRRSASDRGPRGAGA